MAATWRLKGGRGEPKVAQKSALDGLGDRLVGVLGASGGTRRVLFARRRLANQLELDTGRPPNYQYTETRIRSSILTYVRLRI